MFEMNFLLFILLRNSLWQYGEDIPKDMPENTTAMIFQTAEEQSLIGIVADALIRNNVKMPQKYVFKAISLTNQVKKANHKLNGEFHSFLNLKFGNYVVVKGQTIAAIYPDPLLRMPGDIDFLISDYSIAQQVLEEEWNISLPKRVIDREVDFEHGNQTYELHTSLITFAKKKHQAIWDELIEEEWQGKHYVEIDRIRVRTLSPTLNAAYVFIHLFFHFIREGVSLRQLCDWAIVLHHYHKEIDCAKLLAILKELDMYKAYCAFGTILIDYLGLKSIEFPFELSDNDRKWKEMILKDIFDGGNFGKKHHQTHNSWIFKMETMHIAVRNSVKYYKLCPSEVGGMISRLVKGNLKILFS